MKFFNWFTTSKESKPVTATEVASFLTPKTISFFSAGPSKQQVFGQLLASLDLPDPNAALKAILAREEAGSTIIQPGFALPHARLSGIKKLQAALAVIPAGVIDPRAQGEPIKLFLLFVGAADNMKEHLAFLAAVSSLFQSSEVIQKVLQQKTPADVLRVLQDAEKKP